MPLLDSLTQYRASIAEANNFISIAFRRNRSRRYILSVNEREFITDSAYLRIFIAWETFLESSFINYMLGDLSILGNAITCHALPTSVDHAHKMIIGTQKYVDWSNPEIVRRLCNLYFAAGNPFDTFISSISADLFDLKTIRNAAAHLTSTTRGQLDSLGTRKLRRPSTNLKVSDLVFSIDPSSTINDTILTTYLNILDVAAEGIANG